LQGEKDFSDEFCAFVQKALPSVDAAELLLYLAARPDDWLDPDEVMTAMRAAGSMSEADAARYLALFQGAGLLAGGGGRKLRFAAASAELGAHVATLQRVYEQRPVTLIRLIYALRDGKIKSFADAFKLTRR
jgi:hypothetical protein